MDEHRSEGRPRLRPGDVLLVHGEGAVSWAIRRFDESDIDRAALVLDEDTVMDVAAAGIRVRSWARVLAEGSFAYVRRLPPDVDPGPVVGRGRAFLAERPRVADDRLLSLALLSLTRKLPVSSPQLRNVVCGALDRAARIVDLTIDEGRSLLTSSHLVYRCFDESDDPRTALSIMFPAVHPPSTLPRTGPVSSESTMIDWATARPEPIAVPRVSSIAATTDAEIDAAIAVFAREDNPQDPFTIAEQTAEERGTSRVTSDDELLVSVVRFRDRMTRLARGADPDPWTAFRRAADVVTAGDLRYSPSLTTIGSIRPERHRAMIDG